MDNKDFVTKEYLDEKLQEHSRVLVEAIDGILVKRLSETGERLEIKISDVKTLIDAYVKAQEEFKQEFVIMKEEMRKIKDVLKEKLGVEIRAI